jgi:hypothetical protein
VDECKPLVGGDGRNGRSGWRGAHAAGRRGRRAALRPGEAGAASPYQTQAETAWNAGTQHLSLKCDEPLSSFAFKFNLRRYILEPGEAALAALVAEAGP